MNKCAIIVALCLLIFPVLVPAEANTGLQETQQWLVDHTADMTAPEALAAFRGGKGRPVENKVFQTGNTPKHIWVLIDARNQSEQATTLRLVAGASYSRLLRAQRLPGHSEASAVSGVNSGVNNVRDTKPIMLIDEYEARPFGQRKQHFRLLNSEEFTIPPQASAQILIQTLVEGPSYLPFSLLTTDEFAALQLQDSVFGASFYGFTLTLGLLFLLFSLAVRHRIALMYAGLFLLGLLAMADIDGYAFQYLWPNSPRWNHVSPLFILPLLNGLGFMIIHQLISYAAQHTTRATQSTFFTWIKVVALTLAAISILLPLLLVILPFSSVVQIENLLSMLAFLLQPIAFTSWLHRGRRNLVSLLALLAINLVLAALVLLIFVDVPLPDFLLQHAHHAAYLIVGVMVMAIITIQLMGLWQDQQRALQRELTLAQQNARMNKQLLVAEQNYSRAQRLASKHKQQLATASHDLRQPIVSLRSSIDAIALNQSPTVRQQLRDAFDYLDGLCSQYLQQSRPAEVVAEQTEEPVRKTEAYPATLILSTVQRMFMKEAGSRGIELRRVDCSVMLDKEPLVLMRIVSNLVANAIKHHPGGERARVLLGCRRRAAGLAICICDNGVGMSAGEIADLQQPYQKGAESEGEGLGLAIIQQLAQENGFTIQIQSAPGRGSCFSVEI